jgi:chloride channel 7
MTNDINLSLFVMIVVMLSKFIGDMYTHSLVHSMLEFKCVPILEPELKIYHKAKR